MCRFGIKRIIGFTLVILSILGISACDSKNVPKRDIIEKNFTIEFDTVFQNLAGLDSQELVDYFKKNGKDNYQKNEADEKNTVNLELTDAQVEYWKKFTQNKLENKQQEFSDINSRYYVTYSEKYDEINAYYDLRLDSDEVFDFVKSTCMYCAMYQLFEGVEEYQLNLNVFNVDTEQLVVKNNLKTDNMSYDNAEWKESYTISNEEEQKIKSNFSQVEDIQINSSGVDDISLIGILVKSTESDYSYLYIDESDIVHIGVTDSEKNSLVQELQNYLSELERQFEELGDNYKISVNENYSEIEYKFDSKLSKQNQMNYVVYSETICALIQELIDNSQKYYIKINILDSSSGILISSGDSEQGINWNMGE